MFPKCDQIIERLKPESTQVLVTLWLLQAKSNSNIELCGRIRVSRRYTSHRYKIQFP